MISEYKVTLLVLKLLSETYISVEFLWYSAVGRKYIFLFLKTGFNKPDEIVSVTKNEQKYFRVICLILLMRLLVMHGVADGFVIWWMENYRKSFIRNNRVKKISSEPDAVIKRATSD